MDSKLIQKTVISAGNGPNNFADGTKVSFHLKTETCDDPPKLVDDSRSWKSPVELLIGKKFKLEVWEAILKTMKEGEVSAFTVDKKLLAPYPIVSKTLREAYGTDPKAKKETKSHHCCGMGLKEGLGHSDLDDLVTSPRDLTFTIDLIKVEPPNTYEKEFWAMSEAERVTSIPALRVQGNDLYKAGRHEDASGKYKEALGRLEQLMLREKPGDEEWKKLNDMKTPLLLNYSQCQLLLGEHYSAIEHLSTVLDKDPDNVKALYRRGKAYVEVYSPAEARKDLEKAGLLDSSVAPGCKKLLAQLARLEKEQTAKDKDVYGKMFSS